MEYTSNAFLFFSFRVGTMRPLLWERRGREGKQEKEGKRTLELRGEGGEGESVGRGVFQEQDSRSCAGTGDTQGW